MNPPSSSAKKDEKPPRADASAASTSSSSSAPRRLDEDGGGARAQQQQQQRGDAGGDGAGRQPDPTLSLRKAEGGGGDGGGGGALLPLPRYKDQSRPSGFEAAADGARGGSEADGCGGGGAAVTIPWAEVAAPNGGVGQLHPEDDRLAALSRFKDQAQSAGLEADGGGTTTSDDVHTTTVDIHLAPSVYAVPVAVEQADPPTLPAVAVTTPMPIFPAGGINAKNTVGPVVDDRRPPQPEAPPAENSSASALIRDNSSDRRNLHSTESPSTAPANNTRSNSISEETPSGGAGEPRQQMIVLRKHMIWAGTCLLAVVVIAASAVAVLMTSNSSTSTSNSITSPTAPLPPPPDDENVVVALPTLLPTFAPNRGPVVTLEPSAANAPIISTEPPSSLPPTRVPIALPTAFPTALPTASKLQPVAQPFSASVNPDYTEIKLTASDGAADDRFGISVAISDGGDTLVIGAPADDDTVTGEDTGSGRAYVYIRSDEETGEWTEQAKLTASDGAAGDRFGIYVGIDGDTIVIGATQDDTRNGSNSGSAYVYSPSGNVWTEQAKLMASDVVSNDRFGTGVAISGDTIVIGAYRDDTGFGGNSGSAYLFTFLQSAWTQQTKLLPSDGAADDRFGRSVAINGDTIVIGAEHHDNDSAADSGSAYVYMRSGTDWTEQAKLTASDGASNDEFGRSVAVDGDTIVVGAYWHDTVSGADSGSAYVYRYSGSVWTEEAKLASSDGAADDFFGSGVAINGDTVVIGANNDDTESGADSGSAYVYIRSGTDWSEQVKLTTSDGDAEDWFGHSVAISNGTIVIGAYAAGSESGDRNVGSVYIFD